MAGPFAKPEIEFWFIRVDLNWRGFPVLPLIDQVKWKMFTTDKFVLQYALYKKKTILLWQMDINPKALLVIGPIAPRTRWDPF